MLSSIHPLGERARSNHWWITVIAFTLGATVVGAGVGMVLGLVGSTLLGASETTALLMATAILLVAAGALDLIGVETPSGSRQVNEHWIGHYRGWVYGGAFGMQLGAGFVTYIVTWGVYATLAAEFLTASVPYGAIVGAVFGFGRSLALPAAARIDRPSRLASFHRHMARLGPPLRRLTALTTAALGVLAVAGLML